MSELTKNYTCEKCGGDLKEAGRGRYQCPYCRTEYFKETKLPDELILDLHSAGRARSLQRFEDALSEYDRIIASYPDCFEAYWGATLSDYGIQYEKDYDGKMIPTVHRFSEKPVFENRYYVNAIKYCGDPRELERMKTSAEEIERIRTDIKKAVGEQEPYDIFLCYKETSVSNPKDYTPEFYWADELYRRLRGDGYKVFFAKESLPAAKGDYEAHIFPALRSAKLMLILTSSVENVESVWVKNEWSRFIRFAKENPNEEKRFKVIQSGFKPEDLPRELKKEQSLNHDSIGWGEQLYDIIKDTFRDKEKEEAEKRKREADEQAASLAKMFEQERQRWAADEQKKREEEERSKREAAERQKRAVEERQQQEQMLRDQANEKAQNEYGVKIGDSIKLGAYFQDSETEKEEIEWQILDVKDGNALILSKSALDCQKYNETKTEVTWEKCSLRSWLNNEFFNTAFSDGEKNLLAAAKTPADRNPTASTRPGTATQDKIFLLSISEVERYLTEKEGRTCAATELAISNGAHIDNRTGNCEWWLRTPGAEPSIAASVSSSGTVNYYGNSVNSKYYTVRPAAWLTLEKKAVYIEKQLKDGFYMGYAKDDDIPSGKGVMEYTQGSLFEGTFENGTPRHGKMKFSHGDVYEGEFNERGIAHGKGKMIYDHGDAYEGEFIDGFKHGKGTLIFENGNVYEGDFFKDKIHGKGRMAYNAQSEEENYAVGNVYEGWFCKNLMEGTGKMTYANGDVYEGEWRQDWRHGHGKMTYTNGITYDGDWLDDYRHGNAKLIFANGDVFCTSYKKDKPKRRGKMTFTNGKTAKGKVINGVFKKTLF